MAEHPAEAEIRRRIAERSRIPFVEFMDVALYHRPGGYYSAPGAIGADGDFYTSPAAHPAFGALLAVQLHRMWGLLGEPPRFVTVEMGAGTGTLARDVTRYAQDLSEPFARALVYAAIDLYAPAESGPGVQRIMAEGLPFTGVEGCFVSNELLDAFPVHRFQMQSGSLREVYVTLNEEGSLVEILDEPSTSELARRVESPGRRLPEGYRGEVNLRIAPWMREVEHALARGFVITIDYGTDDLYSPRRASGTLQTYYMHTQAGSPYQRVGRQDITAHVDFSAVAHEGAEAGLRTLGLTSQADLLRGLGFDHMLRHMRESPLDQRVRDANLMGLRELVKPDGLGDFKVLVQEKNTGVESLSKLAPDPKTVGGLEAPLLDRDRVPLMEGRYPHLAVEMEHLWPFGDGEGRPGDQQRP